MHRPPVTSLVALPLPGTCTSHKQAHSPSPPSPPCPATALELHGLRFLVLPVACSAAAALSQWQRINQTIGVAVLISLVVVLAYLIVALGLVAFRQLPLGLKYVGFQEEERSWRHGYWYVADADHVDQLRGSYAGGRWAVGVWRCASVPGALVCVLYALWNMYRGVWMR